MCSGKFYLSYTEERDAVEVKDFRPISLTLTYKEIAKLFAERLKKVMPYIIAPTQSAFIEGDKQWILFL